MAIRHIVTWTFKAGPDQAAHLAHARDLLQACAGLAPGTLEFEVALAEPGLECDADLILHALFADRAALDTYQNHPQHLALKPFIGAARQSRVCMDYFVSHPKDSA